MYLFKVLERAIRGLLFYNRIVEIACLYTSCCFPSNSIKIEKVSYPLIIPFICNPFTRINVISFLFWNASCNNCSCKNSMFLPLSFWNSCNFVSNELSPYYSCTVTRFSLASYVHWSKRSIPFILSITFSSLTI